MTDQSTDPFEIPDHLMMRLRGTDDEYTPVPLVPPGECGHTETICSDCAPVWGHDWTVTGVDQFI